MKKFLWIIAIIAVFSIFACMSYATEENIVLDEIEKTEEEKVETEKIEEDAENVEVESEPMLTSTVSENNSYSGIMFIDSPQNNRSYTVPNTNKVRLIGWAASDDQEAIVKIYVNDCYWNEVKRDVERPDVKAVFPNYAETTKFPGFNYDIDISGFPEGTHEIKLEQVSRTGVVISRTTTHIKVSQKPYSGAICVDAPANNSSYNVGDTNKVRLTGWAASDDQNAVVKIYVNNCYWNEVKRDIERPDVKAVFPNYAETTKFPGFNYDVDISAFPEGTHEIKLEQISRTGRVLSTVKTYIKVAQKEYSGLIFIDGPQNNSNYTIPDTKKVRVSGWAVSDDRNATLKIYVNNCSWGTVVKNVARPDVKSALPQYSATEVPGFTYDVDISAFPEGKHEIKFEEVSRSGKVIAKSILYINVGTPSYSAIIHVDNPVTNTRYPSGAMKVSGWAVTTSQDDYISIYLDEAYQTNAERTSRDDVIAAYGVQFGLDNNYKAGFYSEISTAGLGEGSHSIKVVQYSKYGKKIAEEKINFIISNTLTWGIDVSHYQGNIDWNAVKNSGVNFAILKIGEYRESSGRILVDDHFEQYYNECKRVGIAVGGYFYSYAFDPTEAAHEADACTQIISGKGFEMPIFFDIEDRVVTNAVKSGRTNVGNLTNATATFCNIMNSRGYKSGVYSYKLFFNQYLDMSQLQHYNIWLAHYVGATDYSGRYDIWQYTSSGTVAGINGGVDLNWCYKRYY